MSADTLNSQPPQNGPEDRAISVCQGRLEYESDKEQNWYKLCSHCRSSARDYQRIRREKRATTTDEPDLSNRPRKVRVIQPRPTPVPADTAMGNVQPQTISKHGLKINHLSDREGDPGSIPKKHLLGRKCSCDRVGSLER
ncbi:hypothetical protein V8E54_002942 [Elaphomyces granulatus]